MTQLDMWKENGSWHIRKLDEKDTPINLNTRRGAAYVLQLQQRLSDALAAQKPMRGRPRKQAGPTENK